MRSLVRILLALAIFLAGLCPAYCLTTVASISDAHSCCHGKKQTKPDTKPCGQASTAAQALPQAVIAPLVPSAESVPFTPRTLAVTSESAVLSAVRSASPPSYRTLTVLRI